MQNAKQIKFVYIQANIKIPALVKKHKMQTDATAQINSAQRSPNVVRLTPTDNWVVSWLVEPAYVIRTTFYVLCWNPANQSKVFVGWPPWCLIHGLSYWRVNLPIATLGLAVAVTSLANFFMFCCCVTWRSTKCKLILAHPLIVTLIVISSEKKVWSKCKGSWYF